MSNSEGSQHRRKGARIEREIVDRHKALGICAEPAVAEVKSRKNGTGFAPLERWLAEYHALFLRRNNADPLVLLPWRMWARILERVQR